MKLAPNEAETLAFISGIQSQIDMRICALERSRVGKTLGENEKCARSIAKLYSIQALFSDARWDDFTVADTVDALTGSLVWRQWSEQIVGADGCDTDNCAICGDFKAEAGEVWSGLPCGHTFHTQCINQHLFAQMRKHDIPMEGGDGPEALIKASRRIGESIVLCPLCRAPAIFERG